VVVQKFLLSPRHFTLQKRYERLGAGELSSIRTMLIAIPSKHRNHRELQRDI
jgi:hypothetical protein